MEVESASFCNSTSYNSTGFGEFRPMRGFSEANSESQSNSGITNL